MSWNQLALEVRAWPWFIAILLSIWAATSPRAEGRLSGALRGAWLTGFIWYAAATVLYQPKFGTYDGTQKQKELEYVTLVLATATYAGAASASSLLSLGSICFAAVVPARFGRDCLDAAVVSVMLGLALAWSMRARQLLAWRLAAYWVSFLGTFAVLLPISFWDGASRRFYMGVGPALTYWPLAGACALIGLALAIAGTRGLLRAGGTPEPLDPTRRLCTEGVYAYLRHPIQLAEILFVFAGVLLVDTHAAYMYFYVFSIALLQPVRLYEERVLRQRFGVEFLAWRMAVPAYIPDWR